jgi:hypothetical protein
MYARPHEHSVFPDHLLRVDVTYAVAGWLLPPSGAYVADLSCGDGAVANRLVKAHGAYATLGDIAPGYPITGRIEETIEHLSRIYDLFICSETIEHLPDPDTVVHRIRTKTRYLVLTTPVGEPDPNNPEHLWAWDKEDIDDMLDRAGFRPVVYACLDLRLSGYPYHWGIWGCR